MATRASSNGPTEKDKNKINEQLKEIRQMLKELEDAGLEVPPAMTKALKVLQVALDTGEDLGSAFEEASTQLAKLESDLMAACKSVDEEMRGVCEAKVARKWQARSLKFTLDYKSPDSVSSKFIKKTVQRYTPGAVCKHWNYCSKEAGK
jgi:chromosome segregation ATPase